MAKKSSRTPSRPPPAPSLGHPRPRGLHRGRTSGQRSRSRRTQRRRSPPLFLSTRILGSWLRSEITASPGSESVVGNSVVNTPEKSATLGLGYGGDRLAGFPRLRYLGERWGDTANTEYLPAQTLVDLSAELRLADGWWLTAGLPNLLDDRWIVGYSASVPDYSTPRLYHAGIRFRAD